MGTYKTSAPSTLYNGQTWRTIGNLSAGSQVTTSNQVSVGNGGAFSPGAADPNRIYVMVNTVDSQTGTRSSGWLDHSVVIGLPSLAAGTPASNGCATSNPGAISNGNGVDVMSSYSGGSVVGHLGYNTPVYLGRTVQSGGVNWIAVSSQDCTVTGWVYQSNTRSMSVSQQQVGVAAPSGPLMPAGTGGGGYYVSGNPQHAYLRSNNTDLGLLVNGNQTVKPTNGGALWALYNLAPDGTLTYVGRYGTVPGAPPPPNASAVQVSNAVAYAPPPPPPPAPVYAAPPPPQVVYTQPPPPQVIYAQPPPPQVVYAQPPPAPVYVPAPAYPAVNISSQLGVPGYDPTQAALLAGATMGADVASQQAAAQAAAQQAAMEQAQQDALTQSIMLGGGTTDGGGGFFSGLAGGFDPTTLAQLSGGDPNAAVEMALQNGGYDPTSGMMF